MDQKATILAVCISERKGEQKHPIDRIVLCPHLGIVGDAHAGDWHRQVSLLAKESVDRLQEKVSIRLLPGAFAENILCELLCFLIRLEELPADQRQHHQGQNQTNDIHATRKQTAELPHDESCDPGKPALITDGKPGPLTAVHFPLDRADGRKAAISWNSPL